jgi:hypothetical protein
LFAHPTNENLFFKTSKSKTQQNGYHKSFLQSSTIRHQIFIGDEFVGCDMLLLLLLLWFDER